MGIKCANSGLHERKINKGCGVVYQIRCAHLMSCFQVVMKVPSKLWAWVESVLVRYLVGRTDMGHPICISINLPYYVHAELDTVAMG